MTTPITSLTVGQLLDLLATVPREAQVYRLNVEDDVWDSRRVKNIEYGYVPSDSFGATEFAQDVDPKTAVTAILIV